VALHASTPPTLVIHSRPWQAEAHEYITISSAHPFGAPPTYPLHPLFTISPDMHFPAPALAFALLSLLPSTLAAGTCASSGSLAWPPVGECNTPNKYPTAVQTCRACCLNDQPCFTACLKAAGIGARDVLPTAGMIEATEVKKRAVALTCATNEGCYKFTDGSLLCLNLGTGRSRPAFRVVTERGHGKLTMCE
jgi:hypothetical protein